MIRRLALLASAALLGSLVVFVSPTAARADGGFSVDKPRVAWKISISSGSCRDIPISLSFGHDWERVTALDGYTQIWRGSRHVDDAWLNYFSSSGNGIYRGTAVGDYFWCPMDGLGAFRAGPTPGEWCDYDYNCSDFRSSKTTTFQVKQASRFTAMKYSRSGSTRIFTGRAQYFKVSDYTNAWVGRSKGTTVTLQRRSASGNGSWTSVKSVKAGSRGTFRITTKPSKKYQYRVAVAGGKTVWVGYSKPGVR